MIVTINSDYFLTQHQPTGLCIGDVHVFCEARTNIFVSYLNELHASHGEGISTMLVRHLNKQCNYYLVIATRVHIDAGTCSYGILVQSNSIRRTQSPIRVMDVRLCLHALMVDIRTPLLVAGFKVLKIK